VSGERERDPLGAEDRRAVPGQQDLGAGTPIASSASAHSRTYRCSFCGLPQLGAAQMNRSPVQSTLLGRQPDPGVIVGLAERRDAARGATPADLELPAIAVRDVGVF
jgi:hypothetical protein